MAPTPIPPAPVKKRGRPPKYATAAEKQAAYRDRLEAKKQDHERRSLVAEILKIAKRNQAGPGGEITAVREQDIDGANRKYLRTLRDDLLRLTVDKLRESRPRSVLAFRPARRWKLYRCRSSAAVLRRTNEG